MIIGIDGNEANLPVRVGVGQYSYHILKSLHKLDDHNQYIIYLRQSPLADMPPEKDRWQYKVIGPPKFWTRFALPLNLIFSPVKLLFSPSHYSPIPSLKKTIPTIHDIGYLQTPNQFNKKDFYQLVHWTLDSLRQSHKIVAVSEFTKSELVKTYHINPNKIFVCPNGVGDPPILNPNDFNQVSQKFGIKSPYFLSVGTLKPNKNYPFLIKSFHRFINEFPNKNIQLVIAGKKGWIFDEIFSTVTELHLEDRVIFTDYIDEKEKWNLYHHAIATIIPSTYEGFGIPAIESQRIGTPVISSNIPSLLEVLGDTSVIVDPTNEFQLAKAMNQITIENIRQKYIKLGLAQSLKYTWDNSALSLIKLFDSIL